MGRTLGEITYLRAGRIALVAAVLFAIALPVASTVFDHTRPFDISDPGSEVERGYSAYEDAQGVVSDPDVVVLLSGPAVSRAATLQRRLAGIEGIAASYGPGDDTSLRAAAGGEALLLGRSAAGVNRVDLGEAVSNAFANEPGVTPGGVAVAAYEIGRQTEQDTRRIELFAAPLLLLLLLFVFRSPLAAALPLLLSGFSIVTTLAVLSLLGRAVGIDVFSLQVVTGLGVGLAIDYSLFVLARYRIEIRRGDGYQRAQLRTVATAGRTVMFGSLTVAAALAALIAFPQQFLSSTGIAGGLVALLSGVAALVVLPAVLALLGPRVDPRWERAVDRSAPPPDPLSGGSGFWRGVAERVMAAPIPFATLALIAIAAIAAPGIGGSLTTPDARSLPESTGARTVAERIAADFPAAGGTRLGVLVPSGSHPASTTARAELGQLPGVDVGRGFKLTNGDTYLHLTAPVDPLSGAGQDLVASVRGLPWPPGTLVSGRAAELTDQRASIGSHAWVVVAIVVCTNLLLVFALVRSLLLPLLSLALNALTVLASYGLIVAAFGSHTVAGLLGTQVQDGIDVSIPALAFAVVFGLSTDYGIFLFSRIAEARREGLAPEEAIASGLARTGRLITSAAVIFAVAVGANAFSDLVIVKEFAVGVAFAVLLDATIVRGILVPAALKLGGRRAWWPGDAAGHP